MPRFFLAHRLNFLFRPWPLTIMSGFKLFLRFLCSGGLFTILDMVLFYALLAVLPHDAAYVLAYAACVLLRYFWDSAFTFRKAYSLLRLKRYATINICVLLLGFLTFLLASEFLPPLSAKITSIPVTLISGFLLARALVFKK